jgi:flagellar basal-body rod protein FlgB
MSAVARSQPGHIAAATGAIASGIANLGYATAAQTNLDRNTVDMDRERASFADNSVKYEATLRFINGNVRTVLSAITGQ